MILLVHMLFGAAIGSAVKNVPLAIILAFLGHYFLDIFPHIEYLKSTQESIQKIKSGKWQKYLPDILKVFLDFFLGVLAIFIFSNPPYASGVFGRPIIYLCAFIALIPDGLTVVSSLFYNKLLLKHDQIHKKIHYLTKQKKFPKFWKIFTQILAVIISVILLKY